MQCFDGNMTPNLKGRFVKISTVFILLLVGEGGGGGYMDGWMATDGRTDGDGRTNGDGRTDGWGRTDGLTDGWLLVFHKTFFKSLIRVLPIWVKHG